MVEVFYRPKGCSYHKYMYELMIDFYNNKDIYEPFKRISCLC